MASEALNMASSETMGDSDTIIWDAGSHEQKQLDLLILF